MIAHTWIISTTSATPLACLSPIFALLHPLSYFNRRKFIPWGREISEGETDVVRAKRNARDIFGELIDSLIANWHWSVHAPNSAVVSVSCIPALIVRRLIKGKVVTRCRLYERIDESTRASRRNGSTRPRMRAAKVAAFWIDYCIPYGIPSSEIPLAFLSSCYAPRSDYHECTFIVLSRTCRNRCATMRGRPTMLSTYCGHRMIM